MRVEFEYDLGQPVRLVEVQRIGRIDSLSIDNNGRMCRVVYWDDGQRYSVWVYEWEINASV